MTQQELVRVRVDDREFNVGRTYALSNKLEILEDEPTHLDDGSPRPESRAGGRPVKQKTSVSTEAAKRTAAGESAPSEKG